MLPVRPPQGFLVGSLSVVNPYLLKSLEFGPSVLKSIIDRVPADRYDATLIPDRFTLREAVAHLVDFEPIFRGRMEDAYREPGITVASRDEEQMAIDHNYAHQDLEENLAKFIEERKTTAAFLRSLPKEAFETPLVHEQLGSLVIEDIANLLLGHDLYHLEHAALYLP